MTKPDTTPTGTINNCPECDAYTPPGALPHLCPKQTITTSKDEQIIRELFAQKKEVASVLEKLGKSLNGAGPIERAEEAFGRLLAKIPRGESGWLIETMHIDSTPHWFALDASLEDGNEWTKDSYKALRFSRKVDAEAYIADIGWTTIIATEHQWG